MAKITLAQGSSATLTLGLTDSIRIESNRTGSAIVEAVTGIDGYQFRKRIVNHAGGTAEYGPFGSGTVKLSAVGGDIVYEQGNAESMTGLGAPEWATDTSGNVTGLVGPGGEAVNLRGGPLFQSAAPVYAPTLTTQQCILATNIPGKSMGRNGNLLIRAEFSFTNNANTKTVAFRFGGKYFYSAGLGSFASAVILMEVANRGAENSQIATQVNISSPVGYSTQPLVKFEVDTSIDQTLMIEVTKATASDLVVLESLNVWSNSRD